MKALFIGLSTLDIQYFVDRYPQANIKVKTDAPVLAVGGPAANAAITFAALGGQADFYTCIGINAFSEIVYNDLKKFGLRVIDHCQGKPFEPILATIVTTGNSERTIFTHHPNELEMLHASVDIKIDDYDLVFTDGFYPELCVPVIKQARINGIPVVFDGGSWKAHLPAVLKEVNIAICSANFHPPSCKNIHEVIIFLEQMGINHVAVSQGEMQIVADFGTIEIAAVDAIDSLGAGDALHGAFCWYLLKNNSFEDALRLAAKFATFSVQFKGTHQWMTQENLQSFI
jgi:sugar/nucleoside kinase (ribokinase family)